MTPVVYHCPVFSHRSSPFFVSRCFSHGSAVSPALFPLAIIGDFRSGIVHCGASAFLPVQSTVVVLAILSAGTYPTTSHRRFALRALSFAYFSSILSLDQHREFALSFFFLEFFLAQKSSLDRAPRRGEGRVICLDSGWTTLLDAMVSLTFTSFDNYAFSMLWCCTCFASSDDFISVHNDVQVWMRQIEWNRWLNSFQIRTQCYARVTKGFPHELQTL